MAKIRLTKEFRFEMAHALWNYDGLCRNIHGHSYILQVTVIGEPISDQDNTKLGMVMDFGDLKAIVNREIVKDLDHSIVVSNMVSPEIIKQMGQMGERHFLVDYQPTCENMLIDFAQRLKNALPKEVSLFSLKLHETANSFAEWYAEDN
ncbi:6-pyruvoyl trahydropterin synthase family protein [Alkalitalea saponilacus]|uniref:6-carboxy-5,6,7,8-tetrahydropterin synthase n=1 Tax=Alkalitalea saponilacus TaxID=889453 RepID=A0A1T5E8X5_9BACT|nr:6-carboxytetrahydropterin synthase [Alkalitalea saponilacus]ASB49072.1 6-carboxytetrahydropterin synthase QueD [Alkalitalea saponilacus]SKB80512.1 6-pyruvoyltetrahydropterin/6-carboxytetrahydropterin synthase [Alkalitalea saponilacus]